MATRLFQTTFSVGLLVFVGLAGCRSKTSEVESPTVESLDPHVKRSHVQATPLTAGSPLFEKIDASDIGISFLHEWKPKSQYEAQLLKTGFTGGGVCMGDYDGDGWCDVYLTRPHGGGRLYRNLGGFKFKDVTESTGIARGTDWSTGATFVDVDNDSDLDLCVSVHDSPNRLFVNNGDGTFSESISSGLNFSGASIKTIFADYDNDGDLDAYLVTNRLEPRGEVKIRYIGSPGNYRVAPEHRELAMAIDLPSESSNLLRQVSLIAFTRTSYPKLESCIFAMSHKTRKSPGTFTDSTRRGGITITMVIQICMSRTTSLIQISGYGIMAMAHLPM